MGASGQGDPKAPAAPAAGHGASHGRTATRQRRSPWPWRLAAATAVLALCGGLMLVLPVPDGGRDEPGTAAAGRPAGAAAPGRPVYYIVIEEEPGEPPEVEAWLAPRAPGQEMSLPGGPVHTRTRPS